MQFTTVRSKEKDYDIFKVRKTCSQPVGTRKKCYPAIWKWKKVVPIAISSLTNTVAAIWIEKKVDPCYLETKNVVHNCQEQGKRL